MRNYLNKISKKNKFMALLVLGTSPLAFGAAPALAQESPPQAHNDAIEEIVVTARKKEETLQDVPLSVAAYDRTLIERYDISDLSDVAKRTPNFTYSNNLGLNGGVPVIRGVGAPRTGGNQSVGIFIDGIDSGNSAGINVQSFDIERIEVVRGPQSTLFGRGVLAGAVNYISRRPNFDKLELEAGAEIAQYGLYRVEGRVSGPVADGVALSLAGQLRSFNGYYNNVLSGKDTGDSESKAVVAGIRAKLGDNGEAYLRLSYNDEYIGPASWHQVATNTQTGTLASQRWYVGVLEGDPSKLANNADNFKNIDLEFYRAGLHLDYDFGGVSLSSITSYNRSKVYADTDSDFTGQAPIIAGNNLLGSFRSVLDTKVKDYSQELRLQSDGDGPLRWLIGGYFRKENYKLKDFSPTAAQGSPDILPLTPNRLNRSIKTYGLFGLVAVELTDGLTFSQELRYSEDRVSEASQPAAALSPSTFAAKFTNWLPRSILEYELTRDHMIYASVAKGNKPGGFNNSAGAGFSPVPDNLKAYDEEQVWNYEAGAKTSWFDGKFTFNASVFYLDWSDIQVNSQVIVNGLPVGLAVNAGKARGFGFETEFRIRPSRNLDIYGGFGYSPIRIIDYIDSRAVNAGIKTDGKDQVAGTPDWTGSLGALYTIPLKNDDNLFLQGDFTYRSTTYATEANLAETGDKGIVDVQVGYKNDTIRAALYVNNLFDDKSIESARAFVNPSTYARSFIVQLPARRQVGARVSFRF